MFIGLPTVARGLGTQPRAKVGGEGRTRTFEAARATDLQSAAFDRFATSPACCYVGKRLFRLPATGSSVDGAGEGIRTPDLLITNQLLYRPELRQPRQKVNFSTSRATPQVPVGLGDRRVGRTPEAGHNRSLYSFSGALPYRLEEGNSGGHRDVQALNVTGHRDRHQPVAALPHQTP